MPPEPTRAHLRLADLLLTLRRGARVTQGAIATALEVSQSTVSRIERGTYLDLERPEVRAWLDRCDADPGQRAEILDAFEDTHSASSSWEQEFTGQPGHLQDIEDRLTRASGLILDLSTSVVPGLLQTPSYHRAILDQVDTTGGRQDRAAAVAARQRRQEVLLEDGRRFEFVLTRRALDSARDLLGDAAGTEQLSRIAAADRAEHVWIGVVPDSEINAETGFVVYDQQAERAAQVRVELPHGPVAIYAPEAVDVYRGLFAQLRAVAAPLT